MSKAGVFIIALVIVATGCRSKQEIEYEQYFNQGEVLYIKNCSNCHQMDGKGLGLLYPPLNNSDYVLANFDSVVCIIKYGKTTPTIVNGKTYVQPMQGLSDMTDLEIAEITTFIYNKWGGNRGKVTTDEVNEAVEKCDTKGF